MWTLRAAFVCCPVAREALAALKRKGIRLGNARRTNRQLTRLLVLLHDDPGYRAQGLTRRAAAEAMNKSGVPTYAGLAMDCDTTVTDLDTSS